ncbi:unnamed protein product [Paramecium pentaurelia]|uniref:Protein kinase domain-containing protein n=1 Tax=Paramecium pentaurelia TaxID=43138 RepID=A0A8S1SRB8_9CILI|nr:unnamed protein product [Paramecium pentaurelia]
MQNIYISGQLDDAQFVTLLKFLAKEKKALSKVIPQNKSHIRNLEHYGIQDHNLKYRTAQDNAQTIDKWVQQQKTINYWDILTQLLIGIQQMHKLGFIGRSIKYEEIKVVDNLLIYKTFGYADSMNQAPENKYLKLTTYETDIWLVGAIMWQIISKRSIYDDQQIKDNRNEIKLSFNFQINELNIEEDLYQLLQKMLSIYQNKRISLVQIFQHPKLLITPIEKETISNFYKKIKLKDLLNFRKNSFLRDYLLYIKQETIQPKIFIYYLEDTPILKLFYQSYIEIQLLNFAYHLSFYFPNSDPEILKELNGLIIQKMILISKQLKQLITLNQLPSQFHGQEELYLNDINYSKLKKQIVLQENRLLYMNKNFFQDSALLTMQDIDNKFNTYSTDGSYSIMSVILINILNNSRVNQKSNIYIQSVTLEQMFEYEVQKRLQ